MGRHVSIGMGPVLGSPKNPIRFISLNPGPLLLVSSHNLHLYGEVSFISLYHQNVFRSHVYPRTDVDVLWGADRIISEFRQLGIKLIEILKYSSSRWLARKAGARKIHLPKSWLFVLNFQ